MTVSAIRYLVQAHKTVFDNLAKSWLEIGATGFFILPEQDNVPVFSKERYVNESGIVKNTAPILVDGIKIAKLGVFGTRDFCNKHHTRLHSDAELISEIAALDTELNAFTGEVIQAQDQLLALYDLTQALRHQLSMDEVIAISLEKAAKMIGGSHSVIVLKRDDVPQAYQYPDDLLNDNALSQLCEQMIDCKSQIIVRKGDSRLPRGTQNFLFVPLPIHQEVQGGLFLFNKADLFLSPDMKLARSIAEQIGAKIENILLHAETVIQARVQTEMELARQVQMSLLPKISPSTAGLDIAAKSLPALQVGGDFYDFVADPTDNRLTFFVGDVSGKGLAAALVMTMTRTMMRSMASVRDYSTPLEIMQQTNQSIYEDFMDVAMFVTSFVGQYQEGEESLVYANAGHSPVIFCPADGDPYLIEADGTALGVLPDSFCDNQILPFHTGDVLVVATDGFSEAFNMHGDMFGYDRLLQLVKSLSQQPAQVIVEEMFTTIAQYSSGKMQDDDETLIVIKHI